MPSWWVVPRCGGRLLFWLNLGGKYKDVIVVDGCRRYEITGVGCGSEASGGWEEWMCTGCPVKLFPFGYLLFCRLLLMQNATVGMFLKNSGNLLQDRHKNFENQFRSSWDNWGQSWQPSFRNWHFAITQRQKNNFYVKGGNFDLNYLSYF